MPETPVLAAARTGLFRPTGLVSHPDVVKFLKDLLLRKNNFTDDIGAWDQYKHLSNWLVHLGAIMDIKETPIEKAYLSAVDTSFSTMSKKKTLGKSWDAFRSWQEGWKHMTYDNRVMIREYFKKNYVSEDGKEIIGL